MIGCGGGTPGTFFWKPSYTISEIQAAVEEAHRRDTHITVHADCIAAIENAIAAGADMLEHASMWTATSEGPQHEYRPSISETLANTGIHVAPTLQALCGEIHRLRQRARDHDHGLTKAEQARLDDLSVIFEGQMEDFRRMHAAGVPLVAGSDAGWSINPFGPEYAQGLELAAEAGMPAWEVIDHATGRAATAIGLGKRVGTLAAGYQADFILVAENPLTSLSTLRRPTAVFQAGRLVAREGGVV